MPHSRVDLAGRTNGPISGAMRPRARCVGGGGDVSVGCGVAHTKHSCRMGCAGSTQVSASYDKPASAPGDKGVDAAGTGVASTAVTSSAGATVSGMVARMPVQGMGSMHDPVAKGISLAYGSCTIPGYDKARPMRANQDDFLCVEEFQNASQSLFVVLDGHGEFGHHVARYCKDKIPHNIRKMLKKSETITEAITDAFFKTNDDLFNTGKVDCSLSGTTAALVFVRGNELFVGNLGDCRVVMGRTRGTGVEAIDLSVDHKPDRPDERTRIVQHGGRVEPVRLQSSQNFVGPMRVWKQKSNLPGLAVSRSLGDIVAQQIGVTPQPEFTHTKIDAKDRFLIIASDGVWEWLSSQEAVEIVNKEPDAEAACESLTRHAYSMWEKEGGGIADDTTAVVIEFFPEDWEFE